MYTKYAALRDERGMSDYEVLTKTGIGMSTFYDWRQRSAKNPKARMSVDNLAKIAKLFGIPLEAFLGEEDE